MKKRLSFRIFTAVTLVLLVLFSAGCTTAPVPRESGVAYELTVLHTNDHHGTVLAKDGVAGLAERATFIATVREENPNVLVLDAGTSIPVLPCQTCFPQNQTLWDTI